MSSQISGYLSGFVHPSVRLSHMNYVEYLSDDTFKQLEKKNFSKT